MASPPPMPATSSQGKRPSPDNTLSLLPNKRTYVLPGRDPASRALAARVFGGLATNVEDFDTFTMPEQRYEEQAMANLDAKVPKEELDRLLQSIPLEDRVQEGADLCETVLVRLASFPELMIGNHVFEV
jgi:hypothetical protein